MSEEPIIAAKKPSKTDLKAGEKYFWCACGRSSAQPFCDGSHRGTGLTPMAVTVVGGMFLQCVALVSHGSTLFRITVRWPPVAPGGVAKLALLVRLLSIPTA